MKIYHSSQDGFTLIELITAITIMAILSTVGLASFLQYSRTQELATATQDVVSLLQLAKASSVSQVKPSSCTGQTLDGYQVSITVDSDNPSYSMSAVCNENEDFLSKKTKKLPTNILFSANGNYMQSVLFHTITGNVTITPESSTIVLHHTQDQSYTKVITVETDGRIQVKNQ